MLPLPASRLALSGEGVVSAPAGVLFDAVVAGLRRDPPGGVVVLGPFGSGKSTLCRALAEQAHDGPPCTVVPLAVVARSAEVEEGLLRVVGATRLAEAREGRRVLALDGFDEVPDTGGMSPRDWFEALTAAVGPRWVLTSRPGHFRTGPEPAADQADSLGRDDVLTLRIEPLDRATVWETLGALPGGADLLDTVENLADLAASPLLLHIVAAALPFIEPSRPIQAWGVLEAWLRFTLRTGPDHDAALARLVELAWSAWRAADFDRATFSFHPDEVARARIPPSLRRALMVTELDGRVQFGHRSVFEHLLASHIAPRLAANQGHGPDELTGLRITDATRAFLVGRVPLPVRVEGDRVVLPRGNYVAGGDTSPDERPLRIAHVPEPYAVARVPVTGRDWARFLAAHPDARPDAGYLPHWGPERRLPAGHAELPIFGVRPEDADRYAALAGARLPTADEWEKAVRGLDGRIWPWGDAWRPGRAVTAELGLSLPLPARALGAQGEAGLFSAVGGVFEITSSWWRDRPDRGRVVMGGSFAHPAPTARPSLRLSHRLSGHLEAGLRLAWSLP